MSTPTLERGIDQNEKEKKDVIERRGRVTFRWGIAKVTRSVSRNEWEIVEHLVEATEHLLGPSIFVSRNENRGVDTIALPSLLAH